MSTDSSLSVVGICGSLRKGSYNQFLLQAASKHMPTGMQLEMLAIHDFPLFNQDILDIGIPAPVKRCQDQIAKAHAVLICSPEYNYSISGVLKNAIDWISRMKNQPLEGKPLGILGATPGHYGTVRAQMALRQVCVATRMIPMNSPEILVTEADQKFDAAGHLIDEDTVSRLTKFLASFASFITTIQGRR